jgi:single-strand DNA-binding protein
MANFNKVILAGNLTRDPENRFTPKGTQIATFGLAVNRRWKAETGEVKDEVTFVDVEAWGRQAEVICQYLKKGRPILLEGRLRYDSWEDKQTKQKRSKLNVVLENFQFLDSGRTDGGGGPEPERTRTASTGSSNSAPVPEPDGPPVEQDDVPF